MRRRTNPVTRRALDDRGSSLIEVVIACVLLGVLSTAVLAVVLQTQSAGVGNRNRVAASNLAAREIDIVRSEFRRTDSSPTDLANAGTTTNARPLTDGVKGQPLVVDGTSYTVKTSVQWNITGAAQSACDGGSLVKYPTLGVTVTVTWPGMGAIKPVVSSTSLAPKKGDGIIATDFSFVAVRISDATGQPNAGRGVAVTGGGSTVLGTTDTQGCAVVQVSPATGGTDYAVTTTDVGYVDISGTANPSKAVGKVMPGKLSNNVVFQIDRAGSVNIRLVDETGALRDAASVAGAQISLVASTSAGASNSRTVPAAGPVTTVSGLWPTSYGAYVGSSAPIGGFEMKPLPAGGTLDLNAVIASAQVRLVGVPDGVTTVRAVPASGSGCTDPAGVVVNPAAVTLMPGSWNFYGSGPSVDCVLGPESVSLDAGDNGEVTWEATTLQVTDAPAGVLWAVNRARLGEVLVTCPGPSAAGIAVNIDSARSGPIPLPAGDWWIYVTDGPATGGACAGVPGGQYSKVLPYGSPNTLAWTTLSSAVSASGLPRGAAYTVVAWTGADTMSCTNGAPAGTTAFSKSGNNSTTTTGQLGQGTWRLFIRNSTARTCTFAGTAVVDGTGRGYSIVLSTTSPGTAR